MNPHPLRYAISDRNLAFALGFAPPVEQARRLAAEGVDFFQLREKDLSAGDLAALARAVLGVFEGTGTRLLLNGRADVAAATGAHGVHLTSSPDELTASHVRRIYAEARRAPPIVTVSCHSGEDLARVLRDSPAAALFGPVFGKTVGDTRVVEATGLTPLREACLLAAPVPVFALGGVTEENTEVCLEAGAAGIAGIHLFQRGWSIDPPLSP